VNDYYTFPRDRLSHHANSIDCAKVDTKMIAGILEVLAENGFSNALAAKDENQEYWWQQVTYLAEKLQEVATSIEQDVEVIEGLECELPRAFDPNNGGVR
jgi:hypothetical protein